MRWFSLAMLVLLSGCGSDIDFGPFGDYVRAFKEIGLRENHPLHIDALEISFKQVSQDLQGFCTFTPKIKFEGGTFRLRSVPVIYIDPGQWNLDDSWGQEAVMLHELGHCILGRGHDSALLPDKNIPRSLMYPSRLDSISYRDNRDYYIHELFNPPSG